MNPNHVISYINSHSLIGIKAGTERPTFLSIWMVVVHNRIFARSWGLAEKSWYNSFLQNPNGFIQYGDQVVKIKGIVPNDLSQINDAINTAYLSKYNSEHNLSYAQGIVQDQHAAKTMEFIVEASLDAN